MGIVYAAVVVVYLLSHAVAQNVSLASSSGGAIPTGINTSLASRTSLISGLLPSSFSFVVPYDETQACNIFGPTCQTGSIVVGVDPASHREVGSVTTTTTLPCSSYLSAQSSWLESFNPHPGQDNVVWPTPWVTLFGRSPECTSYAQVWQSHGSYTFSNCGSENTIVSANPSSGVFLPSQIPPGVIRHSHQFAWYECCGNCSLEIPEVRIHYFPDQTVDASNFSCLTNSTGNIPKSSKASLMEKRAQSLHGNSIATLSGYTLTSPSIYLEVVGTAVARDACGQIGPVVTSNPIIGFAPGELSTVVYDFIKLGSTFHDPATEIAMGLEGLAIKKALNVADLACPTWGLGLVTSNSARITTIGPTFFPLIDTPMKILSLDPAWEKSCSALASWGSFLTFAIFDPPHALTAVAALTPTNSVPATVSAIVTPTLDPVKTTDPGNPDPNKLPDPATSPARPVDPGQSLISISTASLSVDPPTRPTLPPAPDPTPASVVDPGQPHSVGPGASQRGPDLGGIILSAFDDSSAQLREPDQASIAASGPALITAFPKPAFFTAGGHTFAANPTGFIIAGSEVLPGSAPVIVSGTPISLDSSGVLMLGTSTFPLPIQTPYARVLSTEGFVLTADGLGIAVEGTKLVPGGPAITVSGTAISFGPNTDLFIGSNSIPLKPSFWKETASSATQAGGQGNQLTIGPSVIWANSKSQYIIDGQTLLPGGTPVTLNGISYSLGPSGKALVSGDSTLAVDPSTTQNPLPTLTIAGQLATANAASRYIVDGQSLSPGGSAITISGTPYSLAPSATALISGSSTIPLRRPMPALTIAGQTYTANPASVSQYLVAGQTLVPDGPPITVSGTQYSLVPSATALVYGGSTVALSIPTGVGNTSGAMVTFAGDASRSVEKKLGAAWLALMALAIQLVYAH